MKELQTESGAVCTVCRHKCLTQRKLKKHYKKKHMEYDLFCCPFCKLFTIDLREMKKHKKAEHPQDRINCSSCDFSTRSWKMWTAHNCTHQENSFAEALQTEHRDTISSQQSIVESVRVSSSVDRNHKESVRVSSPVDRNHKESVHVSSPVDRNRKRKMSEHQERNAYNQGEDKNLSLFLINDSCSIYTMKKELQTDSGAVCTVCRHKCLTQRKLKKHYKKKHMEYDLFCCPFCKLFTIDMREMKKHKKAEHPQERITCSSCDFSTRSWKMWTAHNCTHQENSFAEGRQTEHPDSLSSQQSIVESVHVSSPVDRNHKRKISEHQERNTCNKGQDKNVSCQITTELALTTDLMSGTAHSSESVLQEKSQKSLVIDSNVPPYYCELCNKQFSKKDHYQCHLRTHSGERPFHCPYCDYAASMKATLEQHVRGHVGIQPYSCNLCQYTTAYRSNIAIHAAKHSDERPFPCQFCDKQFKRKDHLQAHLRSRHEYDL